MWEGKVRKTQMSVCVGGGGAPQAWMPALPAKLYPASRRTQRSPLPGGILAKHKPAAAVVALNNYITLGKKFTKSFLIPCRLCNPGPVICVLLEQIFLKDHSVCVSLLPSLNFGPECIPINIALKALETVRNAPLWSPLWFLLCLI